MILAEGRNDQLVSHDMNLYTHKGLILLSILLIVLPFIAWGQEGVAVAVRPCGADKLLARLRKDPVFVAKANGGYIAYIGRWW